LGKYATIKKNMTVKKGLIIALIFLALAIFSWFIFKPQHNIVNNFSVKQVVERGDFSITLPGYWQEASNFPGSIFSAFNNKDKEPQDSSMGETYLGVVNDSTYKVDAEQYSEIVMEKMQSDFKGVTFSSKKEINVSGQKGYIIEGSSGDLNLMVATFSGKDNSFWEIEFITRADLWTANYADFISIIHSFKLK